MEFWERVRVSSAAGFLDPEAFGYIDSQLRSAEFTSAAVERSKFNEDNKTVSQLKLLIPFRRRDDQMLVAAAFGGGFSDEFFAYVSGIAASPEGVRNLVAKVAQHNISENYDQELRSDSIDAIKNVDLDDFDLPEATRQLLAEATDEVKSLNRTIFGTALRGSNWESRSVSPATGEEPVGSSEKSDGAELIGHRDSSDELTNPTYDDLRKGGIQDPAYLVNLLKRSGLALSGVPKLKNRPPTLLDGDMKAGEKLIVLDAPQMEEIDPNEVMESIVKGSFTPR